MQRIILHIVETLETGVRSFLIDLTKRQVEYYNVYILFGLRNGDVERVKQGFDNRVNFIFTPHLRGVLRSVMNPKSYITIRKIYNKIHPDIVHLHSSAAGFIGRFALPCNIANVIYTPHCFSFLKKDVSKIVSKTFYLCEKIAAKRKCLIVACGKGEFEFAKKLTSKCVLVNNGIDISKLDDINEVNIAPIIVTTARITFQKNPYLFNEIANSLPQYKFIWIGDGELRNVLTAPNIEVTGWKTRDEVIDMIKKTSVFLFPSLWEGLSISLLEAMYYKKVCVVSNSIGNADVIENNVNGFVCNTVDEYTSCIEKIMSNMEDLSLLRNNAKKSVTEIYNSENMYEQYNNIYQSYF